MRSVSTKVCRFRARFTDDFAVSRFVESAVRGPSSLSHGLAAPALQTRPDMKTLKWIVSNSLVMSLAFAGTASVGCEARERVVVRDRPEVVHVETRQPVVEEKVIVRP